MSVAKFSDSELYNIVLAAKLSKNNPIQTIDDLIDDNEELCAKVDRLSEKEQKALYNKAQKLAGQYREAFNELNDQETPEETEETKKELVSNVASGFANKWREDQGEDSKSTTCPIKSLKNQE